MLTQKEAEIEILKDVGCPQEEIQDILQEADDWDFSKKKSLTKLVPGLQGNKPEFQGHELLALFLQLLRQMRLAWQRISQFTDTINQTIIYNTLDRRPGTRKYWDCPEFREKTNEWSSLNTKIPDEGYNSAFKKIFYPFLWYIRGEYRPNTSDISSHGEGQNMENTPQVSPSIPKNIILYGSPGTGKTYKTVQYAVAIVENRPLEEIGAEDYGEVMRRYRQYRDEGRICFTTFHQSYEYEEFIEGLRPRLADDDGANEGELSYEIREGVFKAFCRAAETVPVTEHAQGLALSSNPTVWKISLEGTGDNPTRRDCLDKGHIRIGWDGYGPNLSEQTEYKDGGRAALNAFYNRMQPGDIVLSCYSHKVVDAVGVVTGEPEWHDEYATYKRLRKVRWLAKDIRQDIFHLNGDKVFTLSTLYKLSIPVAEILAMIGMGGAAEQPPHQEKRNFVFIIDEINRGNMAKIFGELMTLIEESKRLGAKEEMRARLPYTGDSFGVPGNVYIIGTMNTADRSIALMDAALRRRFSFVEVPPEPGLLAGTVVGGVRIYRLLDLLNRRIEALLDRDHVLGHAAFLGLKENADMGALAAIMKNAVLPLLQEYFYNDYEKIRLVLGDNQKTQQDDVRFIEEADEGVELFGPHADADGTRYSINLEAFEKPVAYRYLGLGNGSGESPGQEVAEMSGAAVADEH